MKKILNGSVLVLLMGVLMLISSCSKQDDSKAGSSAVSSETQQEKNIRKIKTLVHKLPIMKILNEGLNQHRGAANSVYDPGFSFSDPNGGAMHFSSPSGVSYVTNPNGGVGFVVASSAFGTNSSSGGTVVAGSSSLDMNYTFCFNSTGNAVGLNLFDSVGTFTGVSAVIGVSGDFSAIANHSTDSTTTFADLFHGLAFYIVYDGTASGSYDVVNWLTDNLNDTNATNRKCFAFVIDFAGGHLYMSSSGTVVVTGGSMSFNGEYLDIGGINLATLNLNGPGLTVSTVPGFGAMGCE